MTKIKWKTVSHQEGTLYNPTVNGMGSYKNTRGDTIIRHWRTNNFGAVLFFTIFTLFWNSIMGTIIFSFIFTNKPIEVNGASFNSLGEVFFSNPISVVFLLHPLVGIIVAYFTLALWINKTTIKVSPSMVEIKRGPLPWKDSYVKFPANDIKQFFVQVYQVYKKNSRAISQFRVVAQNNQNQEAVFESGIINYEDARILETWLETKLSITDKAVPGEVTKRSS